MNLDQADKLGFLVFLIAFTLLLCMVIRDGLEDRRHRKQIQKDYKPKVPKPTVREKP
jgi:hypothetical protein